MNQLELPDKIFFVIPLYGNFSQSIQSLPIKIQTLMKEIKPIDHRVIFVVDGDVELMEELSSHFCKYEEVIYMMSERGGQHTTIFSAIDFIKDNLLHRWGKSSHFDFGVAVMDQDDDPSYLPLFLSTMIERKADAVVGLRKKRYELIRGSGTYLFYRVAHLISRMRKSEIPFDKIRYLTTYSFVSGKTILEMRRTSNYLLSVFLSSENIEFVELPGFKDSTTSSSHYSSFQLISLSLRTIIDLILKC